MRFNRSLQAQEVVSRKYRKLLLGFQTHTQGDKGRQEAPRPRKRNPHEGRQTERTLRQRNPHEGRQKEAKGDKEPRNPTKKPT